VTCEKKRELALAIIEDFCACVKPLEQELERGIIHGDFNEQVFEAKMEIQVLSKHTTILFICFFRIFLWRRERKCPRHPQHRAKVLNSALSLHTSLVKTETKGIR
jgi:hypothetical protein